MKGGELRSYAWLAAIGFWIASTVALDAGKVSVCVMLVIASLVHGFIGLFGDKL